jgi:hypothetical protein
VTAEGREAFYVPAGGGRFASTAHTGGPWEAGLQHGGPPAALLARAMAQASAAPGLVLARVTLELLGPVPVADLTVSAEVVRPGRRVQMTEGAITAEGRVVMRGRAWRIAASPGRTVKPPGGPPPSMPAEALAVPPPWSASGYLQAIEWRFTAGGITHAGPGAAWTRSRVDLVAGEPLDPLSRLLLVADSGNGVSGTLDPERWYFINPELTVHLLRLPRGEWVHLDAWTAIEHGGPGLARSTLSDEAGPVAYGAQSLLVAPRA